MQQPSGKPLVRSPGFTPSNYGPMTPPRVILASASLRRRELLGLLGISFDVIPAEIAEEPQPDELPDKLVTRLAAEKAEVIAARHPEAVIISADTTVVLPGSANCPHRFLGKPADAAEARSMLSCLSGRTHSVFTGICVLFPAKSFRTVRAVQTLVKFADLQPETIENYIRTGEPLDKAGAYAVQGTAGLFVEHIHGSYSNVVGLPLAELAAELKQTGCWRFFPVGP